jgi:hypothetical protein
VNRVGLLWQERRVGLGHFGIGDSEEIENEDYEDYGDYLL